MFSILCRTGSVVITRVIWKTVAAPLPSSASSSITTQLRQMSDKKSSGSGGGAGAIRGAGGAFGEREAAQENVYFKKEQEAQLKKLREHLNDEITHHEEEIKRHQDAIARHKKKSGELEKESVK